MILVDKPVIETNGWKALRDDESGFWIQEPTGRISGFCPTEETAKKMIDEKSGAREKAFRVVNANDVKVIRGETIYNGSFKKDWYRNDQFMFEGKYIGRVSVSSKRPKMTIVGDYGVMGYDLKWLLAQNKLRLKER
jgi:hypothetical protein